VKQTISTAPWLPAVAAAEPATAPEDQSSPSPRPHQQQLTWILQLEKLHQVMQQLETLRNWAADPFVKGSFPGLEVQLPAALKEELHPQQVYPPQ